METFIRILRYLPAVEAVPTLLFCKFASVFRMLQTKSSMDVSVSSLAVLSFVSYLYILYAFLIVQEWQYSLSCVLASLGSTINLVVAVYYRLKARKEV